LPGSSGPPMMENWAAPLARSMIRCCRRAAVVDDRHHPPVTKEHVSRVPVAVDDLFGPVVQAHRVGALGAVPVRLLQVRDGPVQDARLGPGLQRQRADRLTDGLADGFGVVVTAARGAVVAPELRQQLVIQAQYATGVLGGLQRAVVSSRLDVFEHLVDAVFPHQHRVVLATGADQVRQGKVLPRQVKLELMGEGDPADVLLAAGAALEEEPPALGADDDLRRAARAPREFGDGFDDAQVVVAQADGQFGGPESLALKAHEAPVEKSNAAPRLGLSRDRSLPDPRHARIIHPPAGVSTAFATRPAATCLCRGGRRRDIVRASRVQMPPTILNIFVVAVVALGFALRAMGRSVVADTAVYPGTTWSRQAPGPWHPILGCAGGDGTRAGARGRR